MSYMVQQLSAYGLTALRLSRVAVSGGPDAGEVGGGQAGGGRRAAQAAVAPLRAPRGAAGERWRRRQRGGQGGRQRGGQGERQGGGARQHPRGARVSQGVTVHDARST
eukprot:6602946-Pyramimonas_sp.AAC.1